jgi:hypothetical protein
VRARHSSRLNTPEENALNVVQRSFRVEGEQGLGKKPKPQLIGPVLSDLHGSLQDVVRMGFLHSSRARGRIHLALKDAADVRFIGHEGSGSDVTVLHFELPPFGSAAARFFEQPMLWEDGPSPDETAFELFGAALNDVAARKVDSSRYDAPLLGRISRYSRMLKRGIRRVSLIGATATEDGKIDADVVRAASDLAAETPNPQRARVAGRLDLMGASQGVLKIEVRPGEVVTALWERDEPIENYRELFNKDVVVEGLAIFRPSGTLLRIDADLIAPASAQQDFFRQVPHAPVARDYPKLARLKPNERSAYVQLRGCVPAEGDESDEDFDAAVAALR